jgi:hypothetical protein
MFLEKLYSTNKQCQQTHVQYQPTINQLSPIIVRGHPWSLPATTSAQITAAMEDPTLINEEVRRRKRNNTRLQKEEEDRQLIADGEGKVSPSNEPQVTNLSPVGPRKAKTMALKNASKSRLW